MPTYSVFTNHNGLRNDYAQFVVNGETVWLYFETDGTGVMPEPHVYAIPEAVARSIEANDPHHAFFIVTESEASAAPADGTDDSDDPDGSDEPDGGDNPDGSETPDGADTEPAATGATKPKPRSRKAGA